jgi:hypothetical protein
MFYHKREAYNIHVSNLELIHDQLPLAVPCYDLLLVTELALVLN